MNIINSFKYNKLVSKGAFLVDMRSPVAFRDGSVPGATNLPLRPFLNRLPGLDKTKPIVLIGTNLEMEDLKTATEYAFNLGRDNIFVADYNNITQV